MDEAIRETIRNQSGVDDDRLIDDAFQRNDQCVISTICDLLGIKTAMREKAERTAVAEAEAARAKTEADLALLRQIIMEKDELFFEYMKKQHAAQLAAAQGAAQEQDAQHEQEQVIS